MSLYEKLMKNEEKLSLVGLGYVGMPIAVAFAKKGIDVIGYDLNKSKIELYKSGVDPTKEVGNEVIAATTVEFTADEKKLREAKFHIVAVPTLSELPKYLAGTLPRALSSCTNPPFTPAAPRTFAFPFWRSNPE